MKKKSRTLFTHILRLTLIPVVVVLAIVVVVFHRIMDASVTDHAREIVQLTATRASEQATIRLDGLGALLNNTARGLSRMDITVPDARTLADERLEVLLTLSRDVYCVWFVYEPGVFTREGRYFKELIRSSDGGIRNIRTYTDEMLDTANWYQTPLTTGNLFIDALGYYDYQADEEGPINMLSIIEPIWKNGRTVGCIGMDIRYERLLRLGRIADVELPQKIMVLATDSKVLFSDDIGDIGKTQEDFDITGDRSAIYEVLRKGEPWFASTRTPLNPGESLTILHPFRIHGIEDTVFLYWSISKAELYARFETGLWVLYAAGVLGVLLISLFVFLSSRRIVGNVRRIVGNFRWVARRASGSDSGEVPGDGEGEWAPGAGTMVTTDTHVRELDVLQSSLTDILVQIHEAHELRLKTMAAEVENEKLVVSAQAKTAFFAAMSHEIRTPMNAVIGISDILLTEGGLSEGQEKYIQDIRTASNALLSIINDIMDISKMENGKMTLLNEPYDLPALLDNIGSLGTHLATEAGLKFEMETDPGLPRCLLGDATRVRQVLMNLLGNAVKYTQKGFVSLRAFMRGDHFCFDMTDSGVGIREEDLPGLFNTFKRVDEKANAHIAGTGLGLSICRNLVEMMGGTISVVSDYGVGSTFSVSLPAVPGDESRLRATKSVRRMAFSADARVLVVDDNAVNLNVSSGLLRVLCGLACDTASSGREALEMMKRTDYDLVFMDHMMPEMDGVDTTRYIRAMGGRFEKLPIIALTANAVVGTREELLAAGMNGYLTKPIQRDKLQEALFAWMPEEKRRVGVAIEKEGSDPVPLMAHPTRPPAPGVAFDREAAVSGTGALPADPRVRALARVPEINLSVGLENIGRDEAMYFKSMELLQQKIPLHLRQLEACLERGDLKEFKVHVHGIKGSFLSSGVEALPTFALELELAATRGDQAFCAEKLPDFVKRLTAFHQALTEAMRTEDAKPAEAPLPSGRVGKKKDALLLMMALDNCDYEKIVEALDRTASLYWGSEDRALLDRVKALADGFDYVNAAALLRERWTG